MKLRPAIILGLAMGLVSSLAQTDVPAPFPDPTPVPTPDLSALLPSGPVDTVAKPEMLDLIPTFPVKNLRQSVDFYQSKLGFSIVLQSGNYAALGRDYVQIGLVPGNKDARRTSSYIKVRQVDQLYRDLLARGLKPSSELKTQASKMREFSVTDPDGNMLVFGEYVGGPK